MPATLAHHVETLGEVWLGVPERASFKSAPPPDLLILCGVVEIGYGHDALERLLAFVRQIPLARRSATPVLYLAPDDSPGRVSRLERVFDDRPISILGFPLDPDELAARARDLLETTDWPSSLRERARKLWVTAEVERLYAGVDVPALRQAVDPRNAHRPVLLCGEPGTRRGLLVRYIHNLAEPPRDLFVPLALAGLASGELERVIMTRTAGRRATVYLEGLDRSTPAVQVELAHLLGASGALALEDLRWIAAATRTTSLDRRLRDLAWLRVELPPLRARADKSDLIDRSFGAAAERQGRELSLEPTAVEQLAVYGWPGNLRELDLIAEASCAAVLGARIGPADLRIAGRGLRHATPPVDAPVESAAPVEPFAASDEDLMLETLAGSDAPRADDPFDATALELDTGPSLELDELAPERDVAPEAELVPELELVPEPVPRPLPEPISRAAEPPAAESVRPALSPRALVIPLAQAIRVPLRAIRTYAGLVEQRPDDAHVRRELRTLVEQDLGGLEDTLQRVERFARLGAPVPRPFDLAAALGAELDARQAQARAKSLVVLRELDAQAPPLVADESQVRLAIRALLDLALRLVPKGGDLYLGSAWRPKSELRDAGHRILMRFHSPEDVLTGPTGGDADGDLLEVVIAREVFARAGGSFAIDASGPQDNVILVELPG